MIRQQNHFDLKALCLGIFAKQYLIYKLGGMVFIFLNNVWVYPEFFSLNLKSLCIGNDTLERIFEHNKGRPTVSGLLYFSDNGVFWDITGANLKDSPIIRKDKRQH